LLDEALIRQWGFIRLHAVAPELPEVVRRGSLCSVARSILAENGVIRPWM